MKTDSNPAPEAVPGRSGLSRVLLRALLLGSVSAVVAYGPGGARAGLGALAGVLAAGLYVATYLQSHLGSINERKKVFDPQIARSAVLRMSFTAAGAWGSYVAGRLVLLAYLLSFAVSFLVLLVFEIPHARRALQQRVSQ